MGAEGARPRPAVTADAHRARGVLGLVLGLLARLWLSTLRVEVDADASLLGASDRPWVLAFLHGTQWPLLAWRRRRRTLVMVSWSPDGAMQARALGVLGFAVVRGSSSRGGARALARLARELREPGTDAAFAVDGPRGPLGVAKGGARVAARAAGAVLIPMGAAYARGTVLARSWDRFGIAWPFSRVVVRLGQPLEPTIVTGDDDAELALAIAAANEAAHARLDGHRARLTRAGHSADASAHPAGAAGATK